jgi:NAD(P)-dependent dehydrogenase (short-subunit alcohol dehydrogenase family)
MHVFVTGGTGHTGSYIIPELIAAGHEVTGLARSDTAAAAISALGAKVRHGDLEDLEGLMEGAADSDGVIHVAHRQDLLPFGGMDAVSAAELPARRWREPESRWSRREALARPGSWAGRPPRRTQPFPSAMSTRAPCGFAMSWKPP